MEINKGDKFILGNHILMCGDSLSLTEVAHLLGGQKADMIFTDPPYNVNYKPEERRKGGRKVKTLGGIMNDINFSMVDVMRLIDTGICKGAVYICHATAQTGEMYNFVRKKFNYRPTEIKILKEKFPEDIIKEIEEATKPILEKYDRLQDLVWVKNGYSILARDYHSSYENILYYYYGEKKFRGKRNQTDIWPFKRRASISYIHPTMKPVAMIQRAIENSSDPMDIVLDLFGGSGSTLIACENTGRRGYIMELDQKYVEIIIKRWEALTGKKAKKVESYLKIGT
jgi:DNA modification methylase